MCLSCALSVLLLLLLWPARHGFGQNGAEVFKASDWNPVLSLSIPPSDVTAIVTALRTQISAELEFLLFLSPKTRGPDSCECVWSSGYMDLLKSDKCHIPPAAMAMFNDNGKAVDGDILR